MKNTRKGALCFLFAVVFVISFTGCKKTKEQNVQENESAHQNDAVLMAVGEETVSIEEANAYAFFLKHQYEGSIGDVIWDYKLEGKTMEVIAKEAIQTLLTHIKIIKQEAVNLGITVTDDETEEARSLARDYLSMAGQDDGAEYVLTEDMLTQIYEENILANKVFDITTNDVDTNIADDEVRQISIQYLMVMTKGTDRNGVAVDMSKEEKKEAKKKVKKLYAEAKKTEDFLNLAHSNTDAGEVNLTFSRADAPNEISEAAFALKSQELSGIIEGESGYYIIYCINDDDEDATSKRKEELILERQKASFEKKFTQWSAGYDVVISTTLWDGITF